MRYKRRRAWEHPEISTQEAKLEALWDPEKHKAGKQVIKRLKANKKRPAKFVIIDTAIIRWRVARAKGTSKEKKMENLRIYKTEPRARLKKKIFE